VLLYFSESFDRLQQKRGSRYAKADPREQIHLILPPYSLHGKSLGSVNTEEPLERRSLPLLRAARHLPFRVTFCETFNTKKRCHPHRLLQKLRDQGDS